MKGDLRTSSVESPTAIPKRTRTHQSTRMHYRAKRILCTAQDLIRTERNRTETSDPSQVSLPSELNQPFYEPLPDRYKDDRGSSCNQTANMEISDWETRCHPMRKRTIKPFCCHPSFRGSEHFSQIATPPAATASSNNLVPKKSILVLERVLGMRRDTQGSKRFLHYYLTDSRWQAWVRSLTSGQRPEIGGPLCCRPLQKSLLEEVKDS